MRNRRPLALASLVVGLALLAGACGGQASGGAAAGSPQHGGTLKLVGSSDVDHLDPASAYYNVTYTDRAAASWTSWVVGVIAVVLGGSSVPVSNRVHRQAIQH